MRRPTVVLALILALGSSALADKLSSAEWKQIETDLDAALEKGDREKLGDALTRATKDQSVRALHLIEKAAQASDSAVSACSKAASALDDKNVRKELRKDVLNAKAHPRIRAALVAALSAKDADDEVALLKLAQETTEDVAIPAIRAIASAKLESAIEPFIAAMEKQDAARGPVWEELRYALADLLGKKMGSGAEYRSRWVALKAKGGTKAIGTPDDPAPKTEPPKAGGAHTVELFGQEVACTRVVFILDVSGSMTEVDDPNLELPAETKSKPQKAGEVDPRSRIERAKRELKKVLKGLPKTAKVNLIAFSTSVRLWRGGNPPTLHQLDDATREDAMKFVDTFTADGTTATDDALSRAFDIEGARCFYLLSDGEPTKDGTNRIPTEVILKIIEDHNSTRHVRIHTLGFKTADVEFMKQVAGATGGEYSDIK
jgi:hypothetical protein